MMNGNDPSDEKNTEPSQYQYISPKEKERDEGGKE
jgi:hypothetical protein